MTSMGALEAHSDHPLARAIVAHVRERGVTITPAEDVQAVQGRGVTAKINGVAYWLGSHGYLEELGQETPAVHDRLESLSSAGRTVVVIGKQDHVCGFVTLADALRPESADGHLCELDADVRDVVECARSAPTWCRRAVTMSVDVASRRHRSA